ncbi:MAG: GNAT family N-acetyltransferase [Thermodesulfobacteriota bacterium]
MESRVRNASRDDAAFLAWVILTAGRAHVKRGIWEVVLNAPENDCLRFLETLAVTGTHHLFHYSCFSIAEEGKDPVAGLGGYDAGMLGYQALRQVLPEVYVKWGRMPPTEMMRGESPRITACVPPSLEGAWVIESAATLPAFRKMGMMSRLLDDVLDKGRKRGFRQAQLSIYIGNTPAQRAYEKHGFKLLDEWRDPYFESQIGSPGMARLVCAL